MKNVRVDQSTSKIFKGNVIDWIINNKAVSFEKISSIDNEIKIKYNPRIVTAFFTSSELQIFNYLINLQYEFIQCRLSVEKEITPNYYNLYPFELVRVSEANQLKELLELCNNIIFDDRFSIDPKISNKLALQRIKFFLEQSFANKNEFIFLLVDKVNKSFHGFRSFSVNTNHTAKMLLSGTVKSDALFDYGKIINYLETTEFNDLDIRKVKTVISINNYDEINRYISEFSYKVVNANIVLRKIYSL